MKKNKIIISTGILILGLLFCTFESITGFNLVSNMLRFPFVDNGLVKTQKYNINDCGISVDIPYLTSPESSWNIKNTTASKSVNPDSYESISFDPFNLNSNKSILLTCRINITKLNQDEVIDYIKTLGDNAPVPIICSKKDADEALVGLWGKEVNEISGKCKVIENSTKSNYDVYIYSNNNYIYTLELTNFSQEDKNNLVISNLIKSVSIDETVKVPEDYWYSLYSKGALSISLPFGWRELSTSPNDGEGLFSGKYNNYDYTLSVTDDYEENGSTNVYDLIKRDLHRNDISNLNIVNKSQVDPEISIVNGLKNNDSVSTIAYIIVKNKGGPGVTYKKFILTPISKNKYSLDDMGKFMDKFVELWLKPTEGFKNY